MKTSNFTDKVTLQDRYHWMFIRRRNLEIDIPVKSEYDMNKATMFNSACFHKFKQ